MLLIQHFKTQNEYFPFLCAGVPQVYDCTADLVVGRVRWTNIDPFRIIRQPWTGSLSCPCMCVNMLGPDTRRTIQFYSENHFWTIFQTTRDMASPIHFGKGLYPVGYFWCGYGVIWMYTKLIAHTWRNRCKIDSCAFDAHFCIVYFCKCETQI